MKATSPPLPWWRLSEAEAGQRLHAAAHGITQRQGAARLRRLGPKAAKHLFHRFVRSR